MKSTSRTTRGSRGPIRRVVRCTAAVIPIFAVGMMAAAESKPVIVFQHAGCETMMPDERDAGLRRAVSMMTDRLKEIPTEIGRMSPGQDAQMASAVIDRVLPILTSMLEFPAEWAIIDNGINVLGVPDLDARILINTGDPAEAELLHSSITNLFHMGMPNLRLQAAESDPNLLAFPTPIATMLYGPVDDQGTFVLGFDMGGDGLNTSRFDLDVPSELGRVQPSMQMLVDGQGVFGILDIFSEMIPDQNVKQQFRDLKDRMPDKPIRMQYASGYQNGRAVSVMKMTNITAMKDWLGRDMPQFAAKTGVISKDLLRAVPSDARMASAASQDVATIINSMAEQIHVQSGGQFDADTVFDQIEAEIGIHPMHDFIDYLGSNWISYTADSTGGGGLMSLVFINNGINADGLKATFKRLSNMANEMATDKAMGYVRCQSWDTKSWSVPGVEAGYTLTFPGLPVPVELSMALTKDSLVAAMTPQAVRTAVAQCNGQRRDSLLENPRFAGAMGRGFEHINKITFIDSPASISRGYATMQMLGAAVANFVRSPIDPTRDPGVIVPTYPELADGAHGFLQVAYMDDDDFVQYSTADGSWLVNIAGTLGAFGITPEVIGAGALGVAVGANAN